jgi:hypothetical protein
MRLRVLENPRRRQIEPQEADALIKDREIGPLEGFRSKLGRPFSAKLRLNDANEVVFDFGNPDSLEDGEVPDFSGQTPLGACPKCGARVFELGNSYVCEKAVGPEKTCDFRSGRMILQRPIEPAQMQKLLASRKTDLLQFVSSRTRRPFSAYLVVQKDGKVGFEFEAKDPNKVRGARGARPSTALRVLGAHPRDKRPVELHSGRYGPYVKHGDVNATIPDRDAVDALTFDDALALLAAKSGKPASGATARATKAAVAKRARGAPSPPQPRSRSPSPPRRAPPPSGRGQEEGDRQVRGERTGAPQAQGHLSVRRDLARDGDGHGAARAFRSPLRRARRVARRCRTARLLRARCRQQRIRSAWRELRANAFRIAHDRLRSRVVLAVSLASRRVPVLRAVRISHRPHVVAAPGDALHDVRVAAHAAHLSGVPARLCRLAGLRLRLGHMAAP